MQLGISKGGPRPASAKNKSGLFPHVRRSLTAVVEDSKSHTQDRGRSYLSQVISDIVIWGTLMEVLLWSVVEKRVRTRAFTALKKAKFIPAAQPRGGPRGVQSEAVGGQARAKRVLEEVLLHRGQNGAPK